MIEICYDGGCCLCVRGHAGQAPVGHDIVCAGVSALTVALAESAERRRGKCIVLDIKIEKGNARVCAVPRAEYASELAAAFDTAMCGFKHIGRAYPEYLRLISKKDEAVQCPQKADRTK